MNRKNEQKGRKKKKKKTFRSPKLSLSSVTPLRPPILKGGREQEEESRRKGRAKSLGKGISLSCDHRFKQIALQEN